MKQTLTILILFSLIPVANYAQDSTRVSLPTAGIITERVNALMDTIPTSFHQVDSLKLQFVNKVDSLKKMNPSQKLQAKSDSIQKIMAMPTDKINQAEQAIKQRIDQRQDSILAPLNQVNAKLAILQHNMESKVDSVEHKLSDALNNMPDKISDQLKSLSDQASKVQGEISENLTIKLPDANLPDSDLAWMNKNVDIETANIPSNPNVTIPDVKMDTGIHIDLLKLNELKVPDELTKVTAEIKSVEGSLSEYQAQGEELTSQLPANEESLDQLAEEKLLNSEAGGELKDNVTKITDEQARYQMLMQQYQDKKILEQEIKKKVTEVANDYFAENAAKVQQAQAQLEKSKKVLNSYKTFKDIFKKHSTELDGRKFHQRLVPGVTWQLYNKDPFMTDFGVQLGYRVSPRFLFGTAGVYRTGFSEEFEYFVKGMQVYGMRTFAELVSTKGVFIHGEFEYLVNEHIEVKKATSTPVPVAAISQPSQEVYSGYVGLGKRFPISKYFKATTVALYRIEFEGSIPSMSKFQVRFGIDYWPKKIKKKKLTVK